MNSLNLTHYPYSSGRRVVMGDRGAVATSQPLATLAGMEMLLAGGNAVDAAVAMAIALTVVEPTSNGIGGDAFALVWDGKLHGLNASGKSPQAMTLSRYAGLEKIPLLGWLGVTVPGAVSGWKALSQRWGKLPFHCLFEPAIRYAEFGFPVSPETAISWQRSESSFLPLQQPEFQFFKQVFFPNDRAPQAGEIWQSQAHARTLRAIAQSEGDDFYHGALAERMVAFAAETGGLLSQADLATHQVDWVEPISVQYRDVTVWELPPNTQGIAALMALNILDNIDLARFPRESIESYHWQIEAMKLAFADVYHHVADPHWMTVGCHELLSRAYGHDRFKRIQESALSLATPSLTPGGTVYLTAADPDLMVSFIQSNYMGFGSGILIPETGIALHNRALGFTLQPGHPNQLAPQKRPFHTIIPGFLTHQNQPLTTFGVMGAPMQPQGHVQVVTNLVDYGMNPQTALDAPRWRLLENDRLLLERSVSQEIVAGLQARKHQIGRGGFFGRGQIIWKQGRVLIAASEPRADGLAIAY